MRILLTPEDLASVCSQGKEAENLTTIGIMKLRERDGRKA